MNNNWSILQFLFIEINFLPQMAARFWKKRFIYAKVDPLHYSLGSQRSDQDLIKIKALMTIWWRSDQDQSLKCIHNTSSDQDQLDERWSYTMYTDSFKKSSVSENVLIIITERATLFSGWIFYHCIMRSIQLNRVKSTNNRSIHLQIIACESTVMDERTWSRSDDVVWSYLQERKILIFIWFSSRE